MTLRNGKSNLLLDLTDNCICKIDCEALHGFDLTTVHKLSSKEKKYQRSRDLNQGLIGGKQECFLCSTQPPTTTYFKTICITIYMAIHKYLNISYPEVALLAFTQQSRARISTQKFLVFFVSVSCQNLHHCL